MTSVVTGKNQVTIPAEVARALGIHRGSHVEWEVVANRRQAVLKVQPSRGELARAVLGLGRKYGKPGEDWVKELIAQRVRDDEECDHSTKEGR
jgi:AbrB family looped-hinge helix DNA binding protein